jgi:hypothetical protein
VIETFSNKDQVLARYLLNELDDNVSAELEDEMLIDEELYERVQVVEMNLIDCYVRNELLPAESLRFEATYLTTPENKEKVNRARMFHESLRLLQGQKKPLTQAQSWRSQVRAIFQRPLRAAALIVSVLLSIVALVVVFKSLRSADNANTILTKSTPSNPVVTTPVPDTTPDDLSAGGTPTPTVPVVPSTNKGPNLSGNEVARNNSPRLMQQAYINRQGESGGERSGGEPVNITLGKRVTNLNLIYELLDDVPKRDTYGVTIKNRYDEPIWRQNGKPIEEVNPLSQDGSKRLRSIIIKVPTSIFKDSGPYLFEFDDLYIPAKNFTIKKL